MGSAGLDWLYSIQGHHFFCPKGHLCIVWRLGALFQVEKGTKSFVHHTILYQLKTNRVTSAQHLQPPPPNCLGTCPLQHIGKTPVNMSVSPLVLDQVKGDPAKSK